MASSEVELTKVSKRPIYVRNRIDSTDSSAYFEVLLQAASVANRIRFVLSYRANKSDLIVSGDIQSNTRTMAVVLRCIHALNRTDSHTGISCLLHG